MRTSALTKFLARVRVGSPPAGVSALADGVLVQRFLDAHDEAAFEEIVRRHGPMVLAVCRRRLGHEHDAEEAFQATFLLLACKAGSVSPGGQVGAWLHGVALRAASQAARSARRRRHHEGRAAAMYQPAFREEVPELRGVIDEEVARLPERYRAPLVLCLLEGRAPSEAARLLGWPEGSVSGRLTRAKRLLARRLSRRGFGPADAPLAAPALSAERLADAALASAARLAGPDGLVSASAAALMQEVWQVMWRTTMQKLMAVSLAVTLAGVGVLIGLANAAGEAYPTPGARADYSPAREAEPAEKLSPADQLPSGNAPIQVLARLADGVVVVSMVQYYYEPRSEILPGGLVTTSYRAVRKVSERRLAAEDVKFQNTKGKPLSKLAVERMFKKDHLAVAALDGKPVDPLHLRILKDDVPVLILPAPQPAQAMPPPAVPMAPPPLAPAVIPPPAIAPAPAQLQAVPPPPQAPPPIPQP